MMQPENETAETSQIYRQYASGEYWNDIPDYLTGQAPNKVAFLLRFVDFDAVIQSLAGDSLSIVDIGCGAGKVSTGLAAALRQRYPDHTITVYGYDLSPSAIEIAKRQNSEGEFVCGNFADAGRKWDLALMCDIIEHVEDPEDFLHAVAECSRFFVVGFAMDDNLANRLVKRRRELLAKSSHISVFDEKRARMVGGKFGQVLASGYIPNPMARNLKLTSIRNLISMPVRIVLQMLSRSLKGKLLGGESLYIFAESECFRAASSDSGLE